MEINSALTETELANRWGISPKTLQRWRGLERGPRYFKLSKAVRYPLTEVVAYEESQLRGGTKTPASPRPTRLPPDDVAATVVEGPDRETTRYSLREAFALIQRRL